MGGSAKGGQEGVSVLSCSVSESQSRTKLTRSNAGRGLGGLLGGSTRARIAVVLQVAGAAVLGYEQVAGGTSKRWDAPDKVSNVGWRQVGVHLAHMLDKSAEGETHSTTRLASALESLRKGHDADSRMTVELLGGTGGGPGREQR